MQTAVPGITWTNYGPTNVGGRTRSVLFDLNDSTRGYKRVFAASVSGGLWVNNDIDANSIWQPVDDFFSNLAITTIAQNPTNPKIIIFGTGEGWYNVDAVRGLGLWKSIDGGNTWNQITSTKPPINRDFEYVQKIIYTHDGTLYAAARSS